MRTFKTLRPIFITYRSQWFKNRPVKHSGLFLLLRLTIPAYYLGQVSLHKILNLFVCNIAVLGQIQIKYMVPHYVKIPS